jgi:hypothetical protein
MRAFLLLLSLFPALALAATESRVRQVGALEVGVLQAGDTRLRVEIAGVEDPARLRMLQRWIEETADAARTQSGRFPLRDAYVRIQQTDSDDDSPVPWGQTRRRGEAGVLLYVRSDASYEQLRADWTAVHELSNLLHPYLGDSGRWLAEGLASYYQNVSRARAGMLDGEEAWRRLDAGFRRGQAASSGARLDAMGRGRGGTMRVYWAGAAYWLEADLALRRDSGTTLDVVLDRYTDCCLHGTDSLASQDFVSALDRVAGNDTFSVLYRRYAATRVFPSLVDAYAQLGISRHGDGLGFARTVKTTQLRDAIMASQRSPSMRSAAPASLPSRP